MYIAQADLKKAFDVICQSQVVSLSSRKNVRLQRIEVLCCWWKASSLEVRLSYAVTELVDRGVPQGAPESRAVFLMVTVEILEGHGWKCDREASLEVMIDDCCCAFARTGLEVGIHSTHWCSAALLTNESNESAAHSWCRNALWGLSANSSSKVHTAAVLSDTVRPRLVICSQGGAWCCAVPASLNLYSWTRTSKVSSPVVDRYTSHAIFLMQFAHLITCMSHCMAQDEPPNVSVCALHSIFISCMMCVWALMVLVLSFSCFSPSFTSSLPHSTCSLPGTPSPMSTPPRVNTTALTHKEEYCPMAIYHLLTGYEPKLLDDFDHSETSAMIFQDESGDIDTEPSYSCEAELGDETIGKSAIFTTVHSGAKNQRTRDKLITLMKKVCCQPSLLSHTQVRGEPYANLVRTKNENQVAKWKAKESGFFLKDKKSKFSLKLEPRSRSTNFKPILIEEVSRNWMELLNFSEEKLIILLQVMNNSDEINYFKSN